MHTAGAKKTFVTLHHGTTDRHVKEHEKLLETLGEYRASSLQESGLDVHRSILSHTLDPKVPLACQWRKEARCATPGV